MARKLTQRDREDICLAYSGGGWTIRKLAEKYGVGKTTISEIINDAKLSDVRAEAERIKKEELEKSYASMREYFAARREDAQSLITRLLNIPQGLIDMSSLRGRVGAAHYIKDMFADPDMEIGGDKVNVVINLADTSEAKGDNE
jgi:hypothetical protein